MFNAAGITIAQQVPRICAAGTLPQRTTVGAIAQQVRGKRTRRACTLLTECTGNIVHPAAATRTAVLACHRTSLRSCAVASISHSSISCSPHAARVIAIAAQLAHRSVISHAVLTRLAGVATTSSTQSTFNVTASRLAPAAAVRTIAMLLRCASRRRGVAPPVSRSAPRYTPRSACTVAIAAHISLAREHFQQHTSSQHRSSAAQSNS